MADGVELHMNVGGLFRLADALGLSHIYFTGRVPTLPNNKISKIARYTDKYVSFSYEVDALERLRALKASNYKIVALEICSHSLKLCEIAKLRFEKLCLVIGSEKNGISDSVLQCADHVVHIPMKGFNSSMNVISAAAIAIYQLSQQLQLLENNNG